MAFAGADGAVVRQRSNGYRTSYSQCESVAANYAEACEAESGKDFVHKLKVSMKELSETRIWLKLIGESGYVEKTKLADLISESKELSRILSASVITAKKKIGG